MDKNRPYITIIEGESKGEQIDIDSDSFLIGRHSDCQYIITLREISRYHAHIFFKDGRWWIEDKSRHGTFIDKMQRVSKTQPICLDDGVHIYLATSVHILFTDPTGTLRDNADQILMNGLWINPETADIFVQGKKLEPPLAPRPALILRKLYELDGAALSRDEIIAIGWPDAYSNGISDQAVDQMFSRLNKQLQKYDPNHEYIKTIRNQGRIFSQRLKIYER